MSIPAAQTIERRLLATYLQEAWLGPSLDDKTRSGWQNADPSSSSCPLSVQGTDFDSDNAADVAPFTPQEVLGDETTPGVGYVRIYIDEVDRDTAGLLPGQTAPGGPFETQLLALDRITAEVVTPSGSDLQLSEDYLDELEALLLGVRIENASPFVVLRQNPSIYAPRRREGEDDGTFKRRFLDVRISRRERRTLAGEKGVVLP